MKSWLMESLFHVRWNRRWQGYLHDEARVSQDRNTVMLFDYEEFCIWDMDGDVVARENFPDCEHIYDQQFRKGEEDSWLEVIWYDGAVRCYSARDGSIIRQVIDQAVLIFWI